MLPSGPGQRLQTLLETVRANPTGRLVLRIGIALVGAIVVGVGIVLIPLPGPGWAIVILGLAIWAIEFAWAKHLLRYTRDRVRRWTAWATSQPLPVRIALGLAGLLFVGAVTVLSIRFSLGVNVLSAGWRYITTH